jgi:hypothetical protein
MKRKKGVAMSTNSVQVADPPTPVVNGQTHATTLPALNGHHDRNGVFARPAIPTLVIHERELPTFPIETGFWERYDAATNTYHRYPLTLLDLLFPDQTNWEFLLCRKAPSTTSGLDSWPLPSAPISSRAIG